MWGMCGCAGAVDMFGAPLAAGCVGCMAFKAWRYRHGGVWGGGAWRQLKRLIWSEMKGRWGNESRKKISTCVLEYMRRGTCVGGWCRWATMTQGGGGGGGDGVR